MEKEQMIIQSEENIQEASKHIRGLTNQGVFIRFMLKRFPPMQEYTHITYAMEWADRFNTGHPETFMDEKSKECYKEID